MNRKSYFGAFVALCLLGLTAAAQANLTGAIFTTVADGSEVNFNIYNLKTDVYLDGGPGVNAPQGAAGLPNGVYVFQVTDPSGKTLLSTDTAANRQFTVSGGIIVSSAPGTHAFGSDVDHGAVTIQLFPYNDTPNPGGVYKVWVTQVGDYLGSLSAVDPGYKAGSNVHGFVPSKSKTDNFKVKSSIVIECDTRFFNSSTGQVIDGCGITWTDTLGASNKKYSYYNAALQVNHEAHVEALEIGTHTITISDGPNYKVRQIHCPDGSIINGAGSVKVKILSDKKSLSVFINVDIDPT